MWREWEGDRERVLVNFAAFCSIIAVYISTATEYVYIVYDRRTANSIYNSLQLFFLLRLNIYLLFASYIAIYDFS